MNIQIPLDLKMFENRITYFFSLRSTGKLKFVMKSDTSPAYEIIITEISLIIDILLSTFDQFVIVIRLYGSNIVRNSLLKHFP